MRLSRVHFKFFVFPFDNPKINLKHIVQSREEITPYNMKMIYMLIGRFGQSLPPYVQFFRSQWWTWRRLCIWIQRWHFLPSTSGICFYYGGWSTDNSSVATRHPWLYEAPVKVQRKDEEKHKNVVLLLIITIYSMRIESIKMLFKCHFLLLLFFFHTCWCMTLMLYASSVSQTSFHFKPADNILKRRQY